MPIGPKDWKTELSILLDELEVHCEHLIDNSRILRDLLVRREFTSINQQLADIQKMNTAIKMQAKKVAILTREAGLFSSTDEFKLSRLLAQDLVRRNPKLRKAVVRSAKAIEASRREAELNRRVFSRLALWNQKEAQIFLSPLSEATGYGAKGATLKAPPEPAILDRRG